MKATEKQINFLKTLINDRRPDNMEWYNKPIGNDPTGMKLAIRQQNAKEWFLGALGYKLYEIDGISLEEASNENEMNNYTIEQAIKAIEGLKNTNISFARGDK